MHIMQPIPRFDKEYCMPLDFYRQPGIILAEKFITYVARRKNARCLQFSPTTTLTIPRKTGNVPTGLYIHVPFCEELCPYCSFNRVEFQEGLARRYFDALRKEILMYKDLGYNFQALYVGGGTPTVSIAELASTIRLIRKTYEISEISVETNPNHLTKTNTDLLKDLGVHRLSVGVQTFDDDLLKLLKRHHKYGSGEEIQERLRRTQGIFHTLNVDLIFNFPTQTRAMLKKDLSTIIDLGVDQVTYYPLMTSTLTQEIMSKELGGAVDYSRGREFYTVVSEALSPFYQASTAWCFSRHDAAIDEYAVHFDEYAGLGSGSIGHLGRSAYANTFDIESYIEKVNQGFLPIAAKRDFTLRERLSYDFLMKLFGLSLDIDILNAKHGVNFYRHLWPEILFFRLIQGLKKHGNRLTLTKEGRYYWLLMMREFFIGVNNFRDYCRAQIAGSRKTA
jgi:coproporphyrinogen III oxidase-like Fe-S oxidoreductase